MKVKNQTKQNREVGVRLTWTGAFKPPEGPWCFLSLTRTPDVPHCISLNNELQEKGAYLCLPLHPQWLPPSSLPSFSRTITQCCSKPSWAHHAAADSLLPWITGRSLAPCHPSEHLHVHALTFCASLIHTRCNETRLICQGTSLLCWGEGRAPCWLRVCSHSAWVDLGFFTSNMVWEERKERNNGVFLSWQKPPGNFSFHAVFPNNCTLLWFEPQSHLKFIQCFSPI